MRIAIIHPWFLFRGGGERVTEALATMYPQADVFSIFADERFVPASVGNGRLKQCSFLSKMPFQRLLYRHLLPLHSLAAESLDLSGYDLVISSDYSVAKGVLLDPGALHISYCHTPTRYLWDHYWPTCWKQHILFRPAFMFTCSRARLWDYAAAQRVDAFVANSRYIAGRIRQYYRRDSTVIYPPVRVSPSYVEESVDNYYLSVGRLAESKRLDLLIQACNRLRRRLVIAGKGRQEKQLKAMAGSTVEFVGPVSDTALERLYARCRALLFAADEDFGLVSVEAQAFGRPVIAFGHGGSLETVRPYGQSAEPTGVLFGEQSVEAVAGAIRAFEHVEDRFRPASIRAHALQFDTAVFIKRMQTFVDEMVSHRRSAAEPAPLLTASA